MNKYKKLSNKYLQVARKYLKENNYLQACEKYWLSAAEIVKAYAHGNKLQHDRHDRLFKIVERLYQKTNDKELLTGFHLASALHINAYENRLSKLHIKVIAKEIEKFIDKMNKIT